MYGKDLSFTNVNSSLVECSSKHCPRKKTHCVIFHTDEEKEIIAQAEQAEKEHDRKDV